MPANKNEFLYLRTEARMALGHEALNAFLLANRQSGQRPQRGRTSPK